MRSGTCPPSYTSVVSWWARHRTRFRASNGFAHPTKSHHRLVPLDADLQHLIYRSAPPLAGKNFDLRIAGKALRFDRAAQGADIDHAVAHHAAVVEDVLCRHQPVADVEGQQAVFAGARDLRQHIRIPPDVIDVERDAEHA